MNLSLEFGDYRLRVVPTLVGSYGGLSYLIYRDGQALLIDAGEAAPIMDFLSEERLQLLELYITHNHRDHVGGCLTIQNRLGVQSTSPSIQARSFERIGLVFESFATPGHMAVCKSFHFPELGLVFTGDALINGGCGRLKGGTAEAFFESLRRINQLPDQTRIFGGHDYLEENLRFAQVVEPENAAIGARLARYAADPESALFATIEEERATNPFLRVRTVEAFAELRARKDVF